MQRYLSDLNAKREAIHLEQASMFAELMANSIAPERTAYLLGRVTEMAVRHNQLNREIDNEIERSRLSVWDRLFRI